jgi:hypothetical protein
MRCCFDQVTNIGDQDSVFSCGARLICHTCCTLLADADSNAGRTLAKKRKIEWQ